MEYSQWLFLCLGWTTDSTHQYIAFIIQKHHLYTFQALSSILGPDLPFFKVKPFCLMDKVMLQKMKRKIPTGLWKTSPAAAQELLF